MNSRKRALIRAMKRRNRNHVGHFDDRVTYEQSREPTLEMLEKTGQKLEVGCDNCGSVARMRSSRTGFRLNLTAREAADELSCQHCGKSSNVLYHHLYGKAVRRS